MIFLVFTNFLFSYFWLNKKKNNFYPIFYIFFAKKFGHINKFHYNSSRQHPDKRKHARHSGFHFWKFVSAPRASQRKVSVVVQPKIFSEENSMKPIGCNMFSNKPPGIIAATAEMTALSMKKTTGTIDLAAAFAGASA
ncbi:MAG: hypothetical protein PHG82_01985 [Candidatus Gracilibacteria bacterium]|nr:hypothetical protein [Candidatus Gracilibacteria bacterium]